MNSVSIGFSRALHCEMRAGDRHGANVRNGITATSGDRPPVLLLPPRLFSKIFAALHSGLWIHRRAHLVWPAEPSSGSSGPRFGLSRSFISSECSNKNSATRKGNCAKQCQRTLRKKCQLGETVPLVRHGPGRFHNGFGTDRGWHCLAQQITTRSNLRILFHIANDRLPTVVHMDVLGGQ